MEKHIALICDDAYAMPTMVTIQSIVDCARNAQEKVFIHVCSPGLDKGSVAAFGNMGTEFVSVLVHIFNLDCISKKINVVIPQTHVSSAALIKFELPNLFNNLDNLLYLDSDIVVKNNFFDIFSEDVSNFYLAASFEFWKYLNDEKYKLWGWKHDFYFNSGLMFLNLKKMRDDGLTEKLWKYKIFSAKTKLMDQESFNAVCSGCVKPLSIRWNFNPVFLNDIYLKSINAVYGENFSSCDDALDNATVIHYVGKGDKPWIYKTARLQKIWYHFFCECFPNKELNYRIFHTERLSFRSSLFRTVQQFGFGGLIVSVFYRIKNVFFKIYK